MTHWAAPSSVGTQGWCGDGHAASLHFWCVPLASGAVPVGEDHDIVEVAPYPGTSRKTALNGHFLLNACLAGIAMRRKGLAPGYLSPVAVDHGRDKYYGKKN